MRLVHFIGIGGIGMSALAHILLDRGIKVSGSDISNGENVQALSKRGAVCYIKHDPKNIEDHAIVIVSSGISKTNVEYLQAVLNGHEIWHRSVLLAWLMKDYTKITVCGSHGKTTTTSLLTKVFKFAGLSPSYAIGGVLEGRNGSNGRGDVFIAEADESDGSLCNYTGNISIITNIDREHLDNYDNFEHLLNTIYNHVKDITDVSRLLFCGDDKNLSSMLSGRGLSYGYMDHNDIQIISFIQNGWNIQIDIRIRDSVYKCVEVPLIGEYNALNATAAFACAIIYGIEEEVIRGALKQFGGVKKRMEYKSLDHDSVLLIDDYAHHPVEIKAALKGLRSAVKYRKVIAVCQPHRYTRVAANLDEFGSAFCFADLVIITDIYSAGESAINGINAHAIVKAIQEKSSVPVRYIPSEDVSEFLKAELTQHDVCVTLGAGDINKIHYTLANFKPCRYKVGIIFGGKSVEHNISIMSTKAITEAFGDNVYDIRFFKIELNGMWKHGNNIDELLSDSSTNLHEHTFMSSYIMDAISDCDVIIPMLHGPNGEDGSIQGFLEIADIPYAGTDFRSAAIAMDKVISKKLAQSAGVPVVPFITITDSEWIYNKHKVIKQVTDQFDFPLFVKASHLGSSLGVYKVHDTDELENKIITLFKMDNELLVEESKLGSIEIEFSFLGDNISGLLQYGEPVIRDGNGEFINYQIKYGIDSDIVADIVSSTDIPYAKINEGKKLAYNIYSALRMHGISRIDFFLDKNGDYWFNEINPMPGMTEGSSFPQSLSRGANMSLHDIGKELILMAMFKKRMASRFAMNSTSDFVKKISIEDRTIESKF